MENYQKTKQKQKEQFWTFNGKKSKEAEEKLNFRRKYFRTNRKENIFSNILRPV